MATEPEPTPQAEGADQNTPAADRPLPERNEDARHDARYEDTTVEPEELVTEPGDADEIG